MGCQAKYQLEFVTHESYPVHDLFLELLALMGALLFQVWANKSKTCMIPSRGQMLSWGEAAMLLLKVRMLFCVWERPLVSLLQSWQTLGRQPQALEGRVL